MVIDIITNASFLISGIAFLALSILFGDALLLRLELRTLIKSLSFLMMTVYFLLNLFHFGISAIFWLMAVSLTLLSISFIIDPLSKFKFLFPLPILFLPFLKDHLLLFALGLTATLAIFQLAYTTKHRDLIPLGVGFTLMSMGEYLYHLQSYESLNYLSAAGSFLYLFASLVLLTWIWSYLAIRFINLIKS